jgi:hypothetical protein
MTPAPGSRGDGTWWDWGKWDLRSRLYGILKDNLPRFEHNIRVTVVGGPAADLRRIWYLGLSTAFGRYRKRVYSVANPASIQATWDVTGKSVGIEINYSTNALYNGARDNGIGTAVVTGIGVTAGMFTFGVGTATTAIVAGIAGAVAGGVIAGITASSYNPTTSPVNLLHEGPEQLTVGAGWPDFLRGGRTQALDGTARVSPSWRSSPCVSTRTTWAVAKAAVFGAVDVYREVPLYDASNNLTFAPYRVIRPMPGGTGNRPGARITAGGVPILPDDGRVVTTGTKTDARVQGPVPVIDARFRNNLLSMVTAALATPCYLPDGPECGPNTHVGHGAGLAAWGAGFNPNYMNYARAINATGERRGDTLEPTVAGNPTVVDYRK